MVLNDWNKGYTNLGIAWIDYKKAYDMIPHSLILENLWIGAGVWEYCAIY